MGYPEWRRVAPRPGARHTDSDQQRRRSPAGRGKRRAGLRRGLREADSQCLIIRAHPSHLDAFDAFRAAPQCKFAHDLHRMTPWVNQASNGGVSSNLTDGKDVYASHDKQ